MTPEMRSRLTFFGAILGAMMLWELFWPRRDATASRAWRWLNNLALMTLDTLAVRLCLPLLAVDAAKLAELRGWGLLHRVSWPFEVKAVLAFFFLDFVIYAQHWTFHAVPWLWRLHKVHHTDVDIDATTGVRFHPAEILISMGIKMAAVALVGAHFLAVIAFEIALNATSLFNHGNVRISKRVEPWLRLVLVTPDMHRIHHSVRVGETNSNFSFNVPWWDYLLGTYDPEPAAGQLRLKAGLAEYRDAGAQNLFWLLALPLRKPPAA